MKTVYQRIIAILLLSIPLALAVYGWTLLRDVFFEAFAGQPFDVLRFFLGFILFCVSLFLLGGFIFHRDKKRNKIQPKLLRKKKDQASRKNP